MGFPDPAGAHLRSVCEAQFQDSKAERPLSKISILTLRAFVEGASHTCLDWPLPVSDCLARLA